MRVPEDAGGRGARESCDVAASPIGPLTRASDIAETQLTVLAVN